MKAFFVTWNKHEPGIRNGKNGTLYIGEPRGIHTALAISDRLMRKDLLKNIAPRVTVRGWGGLKHRGVTRLIPSSPNSTQAILLVSFTFKRNLRWRSIHDGVARNWSVPVGTANNNEILWRSIKQIAYGEHLNRYGHLTVSRIVTLQERSGFIVQRYGWGFCVYWNGFTLEKTPMMPVHDLNARVATVLASAA